jgi:hypothetical protein
MKLLTLQSVALLALAACLMPLTGCDTSTQGSPGPGSSTSENGGDASGSDTDQANVATTSADGQSLDGESPVVEPMPQPVRGGDQEVLDITFNDINMQMQANVVFREDIFLTDRVRQLEGRRVRISGVMKAPDRLEGIKEFVLLKNTECKFGPDGMADHLVSVILKNGETASYQGDQPISVEGVFRLKPFQGPDGFTWSVYDLEMAENVTIVGR